MSLHKILIRNTEPGALLTGKNAEVFLDGFPIRNLTAFQIHWDGHNVASVSLTLHADVLMDESAMGVMQYMDAKN